MFRAVLLCIAMVCFSCKEKQKQTSSPQQEIGFTKEGVLQLFKKDTDSVIATLNIEFAKTDYETQTGLMYRKSMKPNEGMLFMFKDEQPRSFYMKNTLIPLDIIYLNKDKAVVSIQKNAKPLDESSLPSEQPAMYVLEVNAGLSEVWSISAGDYIKFK